MGRKRSQGKARKAAKAKAREAAEEERGHNNNQTTNGRQQSLADQMQQLEMIGNMSRHDTTIKCRHGFEETETLADFSSEFILAFREAFYGVANEGGAALSACLIAAAKATKDEFATVWNDSTNMEIAISFILRAGTIAILEDEHKSAKDCALFARFLEQYAAIQFKQTQVLINWSKVIRRCDEHSLVKFFRRRIPCCCLDEKYQEVKSITKMGICYNPKCHFPDGCVERSKLLYCSRCRIVTYCSRECQKACWTKHKLQCDKDAGLKAKFDAEQQNS